MMCKARLQGTTVTDCQGKLQLKKEKKIILCYEQGEALK